MRSLIAARMSVQPIGLMKIRMTMLMFARHTGQHNSRKSERVRMVLARTLHAVPRGRLRSSQQVHLPLLQQGTAPLKSSQ